MRVRRPWRLAGGRAGGERQCGGECEGQGAQRELGGHRTTSGWVCWMKRTRPGNGVERRRSR
ncbi:hypothetical protein ATSB10_08590 [Dyella thiooxydans]|uniref:Uncharacterized protein n=1 Tax=Dyella thiooxydans TaxID=445710 RepID=A0A160MYA6_9GAMM|nr:hypothetical protein ATSB10_08590 [Dyella thiooxydans]